MQATGCARTLLAAGEHMVVEQCTCGSVHVTIGALTLRLASGSLPSLAKTLGDAARAVVLREALRPSARSHELLA